MLRPLRACARTPLRGAYPKERKKHKRKPDGIIRKRTRVKVTGLNPHETAYYLGLPPGVSVVRDFFTLKIIIVQESARNEQAIND